MGPLDLECFSSVFVADVEEASRRRLGIPLPEASVVREQLLFLS